jgi:hypothetical protein
MRPIAILTALLAALLFQSPAALAAGDWSWPVAGEVVTQFRNGTDPYAAGQHRGVDIAAPIGTRVVAATGGTIAFAGVVGSSGVTVSERTADGRHVLSYLHLSTLAVRRGETVAAGDALGAVGTSGTRSVEQPHLHFGVRDAGDQHAYLDPLRFLAPPPAEPQAPRTAPVPVEIPAVAPPLAEPVTELAEDAAASTAPAPAAAPAAAPAPAAHPGAAQLPLHGPHLGASPAGPHGLGSSPQPASPLLTGAHGAPPRGVGAPHSPHAGEASGRRAATHGPARASASLDAATAPHGTAPTPVSHPPAAERTDAPPRSRGIDLGWLAACLGLIVAAALLAGPGAGRRERPRARGVFATLLRAGSRG